MMSPKDDKPDTILRRITVEYGHWYVYAKLTDANGKILDEDRFLQPFRLDVKDAGEEARDGYQNVYQWLLDTTVFSASNHEEPPESEED